MDATKIGLESSLYSRLEPNNLSIECLSSILNVLVEEAEEAIFNLEERQLNQKEIEIREELRDAVSTGRYCSLYCFTQHKL